METRRTKITPEEVLEAYRALGVQPTRKDWTAMRGNAECYCPVAVLALHLGYQHSVDKKWGYGAMGEFLGLPARYVQSFIAGVDGDPDYEQDGAAYADGRTVWQTVWDQLVQGGRRGRLDAVIDEFPPCEDWDECYTIGDDRYVLVEYCEWQGAHWLSTHESLEAVRDYHVSQEYAEDWEPICVVNLETGQRWIVQREIRFELSIEEEGGQG